MTDAEQEILTPAIAALRRQTNLDVRIRDFGPVPGDVVIDAIMTVDFPQHPMEYMVQVKATLTNVEVGQLARRFAANPHEWLVVTRYVYPQLGRTLRDLGIQFIDTVGNAYLNNPPAFIHIQANRRTRKMNGAREEGMLGRAGLKVVFALLCNEELRNANYRTIGNVADVALGTVAGALRDLIRQGFVFEFDDKLRRLVRRKELLDRWLTAYTQKLYPGNLAGRYTAQTIDFWKNTDVQAMNGLWGGETAAAMLTRYLKPQITTIYAQKPLNELILRLKLRKDERGDVEIRRRFWNFDTPTPNTAMTPPLLVYADLLATGDARNIETANMIYDEYLQRHFEQD